MKKFKAYWGKGYIKKGSKIVNENFFKQSKGYSKEDIKRIKSLKVKEIQILSDMSGTHWVKRIK